MLSAMQMKSFERYIDNVWQKVEFSNIEKGDIIRAFLSSGILDKQNKQKGEGTWIVHENVKENDNDKYPNEIFVPHLVCDPYAINTKSIVVLEFED